jgi:ribosomal protein S18 acetylase RimI-like enzyme
MAEEARYSIRVADMNDVHEIGRLLYSFNDEFGEPSPPAEVLAERFKALLERDTVVLLGGDGPDGVVVLRLRMSIWSRGLDSYLAELYVVPERRGQGLGRALMQGALHEASARGADTMEIGVDEPDQAARSLYESLGFTNRVGGRDGPVMYVYEREL